MKCPFPGMDPWLEHPSLWVDVHNALIAALRDDLDAALPPDYVAVIEERLYVVEPAGSELIGRADIGVRRQGSRRMGRTIESTASGAIAVEIPVPDTVRETRLEVREPREGRLVTMVEVLSPSNKREGEGRDLYLQKRRHLLQTRAHLVEIDLIRSGEAMPLCGSNRRTDYGILVSRGNRRPRADLFAFSVRDAIPVFHLPLDRGDTEPTMEVGRTLHALYERARYARRIDYSRPPVPPLPRRDRSWTDAKLKAAGAR